MTRVSTTFGMTAALLLIGAVMSTVSGQPGGEPRPLPTPTSFPGGRTLPAQPPPGVTRARSKPVPVTGRGQGLTPRLTEAPSEDAGSLPPDTTASPYRELLKLTDTKLFKVVEIYSRLTGNNVFYDEAVRDRSITFTVKDLPIEETFSLVLKTNGLLEKQVGPKTYVVYPPAKENVYADETVSAIYHLKHKSAAEMTSFVKVRFPKLTVLADDKTNSLVVFGAPDEIASVRELTVELDRRSEPVVRQIFQLRHLPARDVVPYFQAIDPGAKVFVDERLQSVTIYGRAESIGEMSSLLEGLDRPVAQVLVDVKLLDIDRSKVSHLGVDLTKTAFSVSEIATFRTKTLPFELNLLVNRGEAQVLAAPKLALLNGRKASILIGDRIPLELKTASQTAQGTVDLATRVEYTNVGIQLDVEVLQIHPTGEVTLSLVFDVSSVVSFSPGGFPRTSNRTANTVVRLSDGESILLGGLLNDSERVSMNKVPLLGDVPLIGKLFRTTNRELTRREIVMTVTPRLLEDPSEGSSRERRGISEARWKATRVVERVSPGDVWPSETLQPTGPASSGQDTLDRASGQRKERIEALLRERGLR